MFTRLAPAFLILPVMLAGCGSERPRSIILGTTTSVDASGLMSHLAAEYQRSRGVTLRWHAVGSGRALKMMRAGEVDVAITHDPAAEREFAAEHPAIFQRPFARNDFVIAGPRADPAAVAKAATAADAFRSIHARGAEFVSRGDQSGTHARELLLWKAASIDPVTNPRYRVLGQPMGALLRSAADLQAYVLTDRATFQRLRKALDLAILHQGGESLENVYTVSAPATGEGRLFAEWLISPEGRKAVGGLKLDGTEMFQPF